MQRPSALRAGRTSTCLQGSRMFVRAYLWSLAISICAVSVLSPQLYPCVVSIDKVPYVSDNLSPQRLNREQKFGVGSQRELSVSAVSLMHESDGKDNVTVYFARAVQYSAATLSDLCMDSPLTEVLLQCLFYPPLLVYLVLSLLRYRREKWWESDPDCDRVSAPRPSCGRLEKIPGNSHWQVPGPRGSVRAGTHRPALEHNATRPTRTVVKQTPSDGAERCEGGLGSLGNAGNGKIRTSGLEEVLGTGQTPGPRGPADADTHRAALEAAQTTGWADMTTLAWPRQTEVRQTSSDDVERCEGGTGSLANTKQREIRASGLEEIHCNSYWQGCGPRGPVKTGTADTHRMGGSRSLENAGKQEKGASCLEDGLGPLEATQLCVPDMEDSLCQSVRNQLKTTLDAHAGALWTHSWLSGGLSAYTELSGENSANIELETHEEVSTQTELPGRIKATFRLPTKQQVHSGLQMELQGSAKWQKQTQLPAGPQTLTAMPVEVSAQTGQQTRTEEDCLVCRQVAPYTPLTMLWLLGQGMLGLPLWAALCWSKSGQLPAPPLDILILPPYCALCFVFRAVLTQGFR